MRMGCCLDMSEKLQEFQTLNESWMNRKGWRMKQFKSTSLYVILCANNATLKSR